MIQYTKNDAEIKEHKVVQIAEIEDSDTGMMVICGAVSCLEGDTYNFGSIVTARTELIRAMWDENKNLPDEQRHYDTGTSSGKDLPRHHDSGLHLPRHHNLRADRQKEFDSGADAHTNHDSGVGRQKKPVSGGDLRRSHDSRTDWQGVSGGNERSSKRRKTSGMDTGIEGGAGTAGTAGTVATAGIAATAATAGIAGNVATPAITPTAAAAAAAKAERTEGMAKTPLARNQPDQRQAALSALQDQSAPVEEARRAVEEATVYEETADAWESDDKNNHQSDVTEPEDPQLGDGRDGDSDPYVVYDEVRYWVSGKNLGRYIIPKDFEGTPEEWKIMSPKERVDWQKATGCFSSEGTQWGGGYGTYRNTGRTVILPLQYIDDPKGFLRLDGGARLRMKRGTWERIEQYRSGKTPAERANEFRGEPKSRTFACLASAVDCPLFAISCKRVEIETAVALGFKGEPENQQKVLDFFENISCFSECGRNLITRRVYGAPAKCEECGAFHRPEYNVNWIMLISLGLVDSAKLRMMQEQYGKHDPLTPSHVCHQENCNNSTHSMVKSSHKNRYRKAFSARTNKEVQGTACRHNERAEALTIARKRKSPEYQQPPFNNPRIVLETFVKRFGTSL